MVERVQQVLQPVAAVAVQEQPYQETLVEQLRQVRQFPAVVQVVQVV